MVRDLCTTILARSFSTQKDAPTVSDVAVAAPLGLAGANLLVSEPPCHVQPNWPSDPGYTV
ncbi:MAG: hypothetical protein ABIO83_02210 [Ilumatobacteraceae bacterium]